MAAKIKGLQQWCQKMTDGYPNVNITNFTTSWRNGLAFCAIIHRFRPDLIDFDSLSPDDVYENNKLAFEVGESELSIPAFLEADDMARLKVPDKLSVITYVSQYYNYLSVLPQLGGPGVKGSSVTNKPSLAIGNANAGNKRPPDSTKVSSEPTNKKATSSASKTDTKNVTNSTTSPPRRGTVGDKCAICSNKVYLLERHIENGKLYHRSCFRHSELSPTNKVLNKSPYMSPSLHNEKANSNAMNTPDQKSSFKSSSLTSSHVKNNHHTPHSHDQQQKTPILGIGGKSQFGGGLSSNPVSTSNTTTSNTNTTTATKNNSTPERENENNIFANVRSGLKRVEGGSGSKHSIHPSHDKDRNKDNKSSSKEDDDAIAKKAKFNQQPNNNKSSLFGVGGVDKTSTTTNKKHEQENNAFPLSGKEAKKLEKRRQELLSTEANSTPEIRSTTKRGVPLIFQSQTTTTTTTKDKLSGPLPSSSSGISSSPSSSSLSSLTPSHSHKQSQPSQNEVKVVLRPDLNKTASTTKTSTSTSSAVPIQQKFNNQQQALLPSSLNKLNKKTDPQTSTTTTTTTTSTSTHSSASQSQHHQPTPVAKARITGGKIASSPFMNNSTTSTSIGGSSVDFDATMSTPTTSTTKKHNNETINTTSTNMTTSTTTSITTTPNTNNVPKAAPRRSLLLKFDNIDKVPQQNDDNTTPIRTTAILTPESSSSEGPRSQSPSPRSSVHQDESAPAQNNDGRHRRQHQSSSSSSYTPALPLTPPPSLPKSRPPPLPSTPPPPPHSHSQSHQTSDIASIKSSPSSSSYYTATNLHNDSSDTSVSTQSTHTSSLLSTTTTNTTSASQLTAHKKVPPYNNKNTKENNKTIGLGAGVHVSNTISSSKSKSPTTSVSSVVSSSHSSSSSSTTSSSQSYVNKTPLSLPSSKSNLHSLATTTTPQSLITNNTSEVAVVTNHGEEISTTKKKDTVLTGLLDSLAGVRGRSGSTPNPLIESTTQQHFGKRRDISANNRKQSEPGLKLPFGNISVPSSDDKSSNDNISGAHHLNNKTNTENSGNGTTTTNTTSSSKYLPSTSHLSSNNTVSASQSKNVSNGLDKEKDVPKTEPFKNVKLKRVVPDADKAISPRIGFSTNVDDGKSTNDIVDNVSSTSNKAIESNTGSKTLENTISSSLFASDDDIPQWKKDLEQRKRKKLLKDNTNTGPSSSLGVVRSDRVKEIPQQIVTPMPKVNNNDVKPSNTSTSSNSTTKKSIPKDSTDAKLSWQVEAERRMAAFADFESSEDEGKLLGNNEIRDDAKVEEKLLELKTKKKEEDNKNKIRDSQHHHDNYNDNEKSERKKKSLLKDSSDTVDGKHQSGVLKIKTIDIDITGGDSSSSVSREKNNRLTNNDSESSNKMTLSKPLPVNNFNNNNNKNNNSVDANNLTNNDKNKNANKETQRPDSLGVINQNQKKDKDKRGKSDVKSSDGRSPKAKKKISLLGKKEEKEIILPSPNTPTPTADKKKIGIVGKFDFDAESVSDIESSLILSTRQMTVKDQEDNEITPVRPPRTQSQTNNKVASPRQISAIELQQQLMEIDTRLTDLELRGRDLEDSIRNASFQEGSTEDIDGEEEEDDDRLMIEWFQLVSEKNDLVRQEADLVYISREQELEDDQEHIEHQLRYLMSRDDITKSPQEKEEETYLLQRKLDIVNSRNSIIESMDEDRIRYEEEDKGIASVLKTKGFWKDNGTLKAEKGKKVANSMFYA